MTAFYLITLTILLALTALKLAATANRAANLEYLLTMERAITTELTQQWTDSSRELEHVRHLHASLLAENNTLCVDLMATEKEAQYLRGYVRKSKDVTAGVVLLHGAPVARQLHVANVEAMP